MGEILQYRDILRARRSGGPIPKERYETQRQPAHGYDLSLDMWIQALTSVSRLVACHTYFLELRIAYVPVRRLSHFDRAIGHRA